MPILLHTNGILQLTRTFSRLACSISSTPKLPTLNLSSTICETNNNNNQKQILYNTSLTFLHNSINLDNVSNRNPLIPRKEIIDLPVLDKIIENPNLVFEIIDKPKYDHSMELPKHRNNNTNSDGIQAARLIVIRRRKMKKHKLKKLRKKMKFAWAKVRQRREMRKEKTFQAILLTQIRDAEKFSAEQYVAEKIRAATETPLPRFWKGKRLPQFIIKQKLGIE